MYQSYQYITNYIDCIFKIQIHKIPIEIQNGFKVVKK